MDVKTCFKCGTEKPLKDFYKHPEMVDGHVNKCKECNKKDSTENRNANLKYYQKYDRDRAQNPNRVAKRKEIAERWRKDPKLKKRKNEKNREWQTKNKIKRAAHVLTNNAIRNGRITKQPCEICGNKKSDAHHDDYEKPLEVRWLCRKHHAEHHKNERERNH